MVEFKVPYRIDGVYRDSFEGAGLVVDAERGLVLVDRDTVPVALGDLSITFAASVEVPGEVVYLHPAHNLAVVGYDPALLGETPVRSAEFRTEALSVGDETWLVGLSRRHRVVSRKTRVSRIEALTFPIAKAPRFREAEIELIALDDATATLGGVLADEKGRVLAHWGSFSVQRDTTPDSLFAGIPAARVLEIVEPLRAGRRVGWRDLGVELRTITVAEARNRGLGAAAASRLEGDGDRRPRVLAVGRKTAGTAAAELLEVGDLLLSIDGRPVTNSAEVERAAQGERLLLSVLRDGEELALEVATEPLEGRGTDRCLLWAGTLLQNPHRALAEQRGLVPEGVYVSWLWYGSPANRYGLHATRRIVAVNGVEVPDLDAFLKEVADLPDRQPVRLRVLDLEGRAQVITLKLDLRFWPTVEIRRGERGWQRIDPVERASGSGRGEEGAAAAGPGSGG
jgi:S1-C subfamily serine protease